MTLLEMIKRYEGIQKKMIAESGSRPTGDLAAINEVLKDLRSVAGCVSTDTTYTKVRKQLDKAIVNDDPDGALTWTDVLSRLPM